MTALISVRGLDIRSDRGGEILRGASLALEPGRVLALIGESGAGPRVLICDEITSALDPVVQRRIVELLRELQHSTGIAIIFISHDLPLAGLIEIAPPPGSPPTPGSPEPAPCSRPRPRSAASSPAAAPNAAARTPFRIIRLPRIASGARRSALPQPDGGSRCPLSTECASST